MKVKNLLLTFALLLGASSAWADNKLSVSDVTVLPSGETKMIVSASLENSNLIGAQFDITFPTGISVTARKNVAGTKHGVSMSEIDGAYRFVLADTEDNGAFPTGDISLVELTLTTKGLTDGDKLAGKITGITFPEKVGDKQTGIDFADVNFKIAVDKYAIVLDENSTTAPEAATGIDLKVKRTIKANEWSTIVLPFAMTEAQVKAAFGDKVQLADFAGYDFDEENDELKVKFTTGITAIEANHPYIIKVETAVSEFTVDGVDVAPAEAVVATVKRTKKAYSEMIGVYEAGTTLEENTLFISGNKFFYSTGETKIKAFRGYFDFYDELTDKAVASRVVFVFDETTGIKNAKIASEDKVFDLQGRQVENAGKGVYIVGGKKVVVK